MKHHLVHRHVVYVRHAHGLGARSARDPGGPLHQVGSSLAHSIPLLGTLLPLLALALAAFLLVLVWRAWGRRRLAAEGRFFEVRLGEQVSRAAVESLMSTLAGGLPRPLLGPAPWVAFWLSSAEDRAECGVFASAGVPVGQVRAAVEQGLGGVTLEGIWLGPPAEVCGHVRVASLAPGGSRFCRCGSITALTPPANCLRRCARMNRARAARSSSSCRRLRVRRRIGRVGRHGGCAPATAYNPAWECARSKRLAGCCSA